MILFANQFVNGISIGATYALIALGATLIFGVLRMLQMAHGAVYMAAGFIGYSAAIVVGGSFGIALLAAVLGGAVLGLVSERIGFYPLRNAPHYAPLISTIGLALVFQELARIVWGPQRQPFPVQLDLGALNVGPVSISGVRLLVIGCAAALMLVLQLWLSRTQMGRAARATAIDGDAALLVGIDVERIVLIIFAVASALAGAASVMVAVQYGNIDIFVGLNALTIAFTAALLGGVGSVPGAMVGGLLLGLIEAFAAGYLPQGFSDAAPVVILLVVLTLRPNGLLGSSSALPT